MEIKLRKYRGGLRFGRYTQRRAVRALRLAHVRVASASRRVRVQAPAVANWRASEIQVIPLRRPLIRGWVRMLPTRAAGRLLVGYWSVTNRVPSATGVGYHAGCHAHPDKARHHRARAGGRARLGRTGRRQDGPARKRHASSRTRLQQVATCLGSAAALYGTLQRTGLSGTV